MRLGGWAMFRVCSAWVNQLMVSCREVWKPVAKATASSSFACQTEVKVNIKYATKHQPKKNKRPLFPHCLTLRSSILVVRLAHLFCSMARFCWVWVAPGPASSPPRASSIDSPWSSRRWYWSARWVSWAWSSWRQRRLKLEMTKRLVFLCFTGSFRTMEDIKLS